MWYHFKSALKALLETKRSEHDSAQAEVKGEWIFFCMVMSESALKGDVWWPGRVLFSIQQSCRWNCNQRLKNALDLRKDMSVSSNLYLAKDFSFTSNLLYVSVSIRGKDGAWKEDCRTDKKWLQSGYRWVKVSSAQVFIVYFRFIGNGFAPFLGGQFWTW